MDFRELRQTLQRLVDAAIRRDRKNGVDSSAVAEAAAGLTSLTELVEGLQQSLPASYLKLLSVHDGIHGVFGDGGDFLSSDYRGERNEEWRGCAALHATGAPGFENLSFIAMDSSGNALAFDVSSRDAEGEMRLCQIVDHHHLVWHESLETFLLTYIEELER